MILAGIGIIGSREIPEAITGIQVTIKEEGDNVIVSLSGNLNIEGLSIFNESATLAGPGSINPEFPELLMVGGSGNFTIYSAFVAPSLSFGPGSFTPSEAHTGDVIGIFPLSSFLYLPLGYTSGTFLSSTITFFDKTLAVLGVIPGMYTYALRSGSDVTDSVTLIIG